MFRRNRQTRGVTLVELIVGILVSVVVLTLILLFIDKLRGHAYRGMNQNNMRRMGEGIRVYHDIYQSFPVQPKNKNHKQREP